MRFVRASLSLIFALSLLSGCDLATVTRIPPGASGVRVERLIVHYTIADELLAPFAGENHRGLLALGELPRTTELLLYAEIAGEKEPWFHLRSSSGSEELSREEAGIPTGSAGEARVLAALLAYAETRAPGAETHLIISGRGSFDESAAVAGNSQTRLEVGELAEAAGVGKLESITLDTSYGAAFSLLFELREAAQRLLASPGVVSLRGLAPEPFLAGLLREKRVETAILDAFRENHETREQAAFGSFDTAGLERSSASLEELFRRLEEELADPLERIALRDLLFDPSPYQLSAGPLFLSLREMANVVSGRYPALGLTVVTLEEQLADLSEMSWSSVGESVTPSIYLVSLDESGAPEGHAGCYLPERPGGEIGEFVRSSLWAPRLLEERGILYLLWYDLLPAGGPR